MLRQVDLVLEAIIQELTHPEIYLNISEDRSELLPFFRQQLERHKGIGDDEFQCAGR